MIENENCPCKRVKCERHGDCIVCKEHHKQKNTLCACERIKNKVLRKNKRNKIK